MMCVWWNLVRLRLERGWKTIWVSEVTQLSMTWKTFARFVRLAVNLCFDRPLKTRQLLLCGLSNTPLLFRLLSPVLERFYASSRVDDYSGAHDFYDIWLYDLTLDSSRLFPLSGVSADCALPSLGGPDSNYLQLQGLAVHEKESIAQNFPFGLYSMSFTPS